MEENIAILMVDLSGYTALTETHGSFAAADLIDKYIGIVENCLVGDSKFHERTGDEIMIVSTSPDFLLATTLLIERNTLNEENFLQVHGGLHYGKVLKRSNSYFGSAINLTSRIAANAKEGTFCCSDEFVNALSNKSLYTLKSKGYHLFKNIGKEKEIFELGVENRRTFYVDPVCRMLILAPHKAISHPIQSDLYFCSPDCLAIYKSNLRVTQ